MNNKKITIIGLFVAIVVLSTYIIYEKIEENKLLNEIELYQKGYDDGIIDIVNVIFEQTENCGVSNLEIANISKKVIDLSCLNLENLEMP